MSRTLPLFSLLASLAAAQQCDLQFDGRIPQEFSPENLDVNNGIFSPDNVFGQALQPSDFLILDSPRPSLFDDVVTAQPIEVTISDASLFAPNPDFVQTGFRRAELIPASNSGTDDSTVGIKTLHFSLMKDEARPLNLSHEYQLVFLEDNAFSTNQIVLKTGTILGGGGDNDPDTLQFFGNVAEAAPGLIFSQAFTEGIFHNFAVTLDFISLTTQVFYSQGNDALEAVTNAIANDVSGQGQFHFGALKKGLDGGDNIVVDGVQPAGIDEGVIFGGIFQEDSSLGCVSLAP